MAGGREWEGYRDGRQLEHLLQRLDAQERRRVGRALAGRARLQPESDTARALQELLVAAVGGQARAEEIVRGNRRFQQGIRNPAGNPPTLIFPVDGQIGARTRYLRRHVRDSRAIAELQRRLWEAGLYRGRIDGIPGQLTLAALAQAHESDATFRRVFGVARARPPPPATEEPPRPPPAPPPEDLSADRLAALEAEVRFMAEPVYRPGPPPAVQAGLGGSVDGPVIVPPPPQPAAPPLPLVPVVGSDTVTINGVTLTRDRAREYFGPNSLGFNEFVSLGFNEFVANAITRRPLPATLTTASQRASELRDGWRIMALPLMMPPLAVLLLP